MKIDRNVAVHLKEVGKHTVIQLRGKDLEEAHCTDGSAHLEALAFTEIKGSGCNKVLGRKPRSGYHVIGKSERLMRVHVEHIMQHFQPFVAGQRLSLHTESFEIVENIRFDTIQLCFCGTNGVSLHTEGDVLTLEQTVVAFGELILEHIGIFLADVIERILLFGNGDLFSELSDVGFLVDKRELNKDGAVKVVQKVTPVLEDGCLVLVLGKLIVDVVIPDSFGIETAVDLADAVFAHLHIGDRLLRGLGNFLCFPVFFLLHDDPLLFLRGKCIAVDLTVFHDLFRLICLLGFVCQSAIPPVL